MAKITIAVAGEGKIQLPAAKALLNDWLGFGEEDESGYPAPSKNDILVLIPAPAGEPLSEGVATVLEWIEYADVPYIVVTDDAENRSLRKLVRSAHDVVETNNIGAGLISGLDVKGDKYLVLCWGEDGDEFSDSLLDLATEAEIPIKDLTAGLDDIAFAEEDGRDAEDIHHEPRKAEEPLEEPEEPLTEDLPHDRHPAPSAQGEIYDVLTAVHAYLQAQDQADAVRNLRFPMEPSPLTERVLQALLSLSRAPGATESDVEPEEAPAPSRGRPRKDGTPAQPRSEDDLKVAYILGEDGEYRKRGRGRPRRGETVVMLSPEEITELGIGDE